MAGRFFGLHCHARYRADCLFRQRAFGHEPFGAGAVLQDNLSAVTAALEVKNGLHNTPQMLSRMAREAAEIWSEKNG
ncbi:MAG: hypothetical protein FWC42_08565 [Proteobacteria bacterium]|nr:hypothetical protein [Pseudomonadota bacterium]